jgi:uncharacterized protein (TIGR00730 family)
MPERPLRRVCVFCASNPGADPRFLESARDLGRVLAGRGIGIVYGGGRVGMMGALADAALAAGGAVTGVIPDALTRREVAHQGLADLRVVPSMHARKALMAELSDAFVALPGGFGTLEELMEIVTWGQLGIHRKPIAVVNVAGYYDGLLAFLDHGVASGLILAPYRDLLAAAAGPAEVLSVLERHALPDVPRWATTEET